MAVDILVVCEAQADQETACGFADRALLAAIDWLELGHLEAMRAWVGLDDDLSYLPWTHVTSAADDLKIPRRYGMFDGAPGAPDAAIARRALLLSLAIQPGGVLLIRDSDRHLSRRIGLEQARSSVTADFPIVIGVAHVKRECWVLNGYSPESAGESERIDSLRKELGFNPCERAHDLTAIHIQDKRSAKRVLQALIAGDRDREAACWTTADLQLLRTRGEETGLCAYLEEVEKMLTPLFD